MNDDVKPELPKVRLATQEWTLREMADTERRVEKSFHDQTKYLAEGMSRIDASLHELTILMGQKFDSQTRWLVGLVVMMTVTVVISVLFK